MVGIERKRIEVELRMRKVREEKTWLWSSVAGDAIVASVG